MPSASPLAVVLALASLFPLSCGKPERPDARPAPSARPAVVFLPEGREPVRVEVEVVRTEADRARGLMHRRELAPDAGMVFLFAADEEQTFWMKNTLIPLDMIFIRSDLYVVGVVENAEPLTLSGRTCGRPSRFVLEVNGGWARAHGVGPGTVARFEGISLLPVDD